MQPSPLICSYRLSGKSEQLSGFNWAFPVRHAPTAVQARIKLEFKHRAPTRRRRDQHKVCLRHDQHAGKLFGGEMKEQIPNTFEEDMALPQAAHWKAASDKEIASLNKRGVYELVPITAVPTGQRMVGTRWINNIKTDGTYRGHLAVRGWSLVPRIDCDGTFASVCRLQSIRMMLTIAAKLVCGVLMLDVQTGFLNTDVQKDLLSRCPPATKPPKRPVYL